jgi:UDP-glucose 4,6-dehydratase
MSCFVLQTHVDNSFGNSLAFTMNNTYGTHVLLEACRKVGTIRRFINVSTDEVYGETSLGKEQGGWPDLSSGYDLYALRVPWSLPLSGLAESSHLDPTNPYSAAKAGAEMLCNAYKNSYNMPIIISRGNNVYGPNQFPEKLIPKMILLGKLSKPLPVHGPGTALRSYLYVTDVAEAFNMILHHGKIGEIYNIGSNKEQSVLSIATEIGATFGVAVEHVRDRAFNDSRYFIGSEKLEALGWAPKVSWSDGLAATIDWYMNADLDTHWPQWRNFLGAHPEL